MSLSSTDKKEIQQLISAEIRTAVLPHLEALNAARHTSGQLPKGPAGQSPDSSTATQIPSLPAGTTEVKLEFLYREMYLRFGYMNEHMKQRFEHMDRHLETMQQQMDRRFRVVYWVLGVIITLWGGSAMLILNLLFGILRTLTQ